MDAVGVLLFYFLVYSGIATIIIFIFMLILAMVKADKSKVKSAFKVLAFYISVVLIIIIGDMLQRWHFNKIPALEVNEGQMTVLNSGTTSIGSYATYDFSKDGIIEETDAPEYRYGLRIKFGFTFTARKEGMLYLLVIESEYGNFAYADVYEVIVDENKNITIKDKEHIEHLNFAELIDYLADKYGFSKDALTEKYKKYLPN